MAVDCHLKFRGWSHLLSRPGAQVGRRIGRGRSQKRRSGRAAGELTTRYAITSRKLPTWIADGPLRFQSDAEGFVFPAEVVWQLLRRMAKRDRLLVQMEEFQQNKFSGGAAWRRISTSVHLAGGTET